MRNFRRCIWNWRDSGVRWRKTWSFWIISAVGRVFGKTDAEISVVSSRRLLRKELFDRIAAHRNGRLKWRHIVNGFMDLREVEGSRDGRRARLRIAPVSTIDRTCRALGIAMSPVLQELAPIAISP